LGIKRGREGREISRGSKKERKSKGARTWARKPSGVTRWEEHGLTSQRQDEGRKAVRKKQYQTKKRMAEKQGQSFSAPSTMRC